MVEGVLFGTMECFITPTSFLSGTDARFQIFDAPGIFDSPEHLARVIHDPAYRDHFETIALDKGIRVIGAIFNSPMLVRTKRSEARRGGKECVSTCRSGRAPYK